MSAKAIDLAAFIALILLGLALIQSAVALAAMSVARILMCRADDHSPLRLVGAGIAGIGLAGLMQQIIPGA